MTDKLNIAIITGSTRPNRVGDAVAEWVHAEASTRDDANFTLLKIADFDLPLLAEPEMAATGKYELPATRAWSTAVAPHDGYIFVTPEYNHSTSAALKNSIDALYAEWVNKSAAFVGYSWGDGIRPVEHLRQIMANFHVSCVRNQVGVNLGADYKDDVFTPRDHLTPGLHKTIDELLVWAQAMRSVRNDSK